MTSENQILDRWKSVSSDDQRKQGIYWLRLVAANYLALSGGGSNMPEKSSGVFPNVIKSDFEEGRHSIITVNTAVQMKSLTFSEPNLRWTGIEQEVSEVRKAYYTKLWRQQMWDYHYRDKLLDMLIAGEGSIEVAMRGDCPYAEYVDSLDLWWDTAFRHPMEKRFVFREKHMPLSTAVERYPAIAQKYPYFKDSSSEKRVTLRFYWDKDTRAILLGGDFVCSPEANPYGEIPIHTTVLQQELSVSHATGMVEQQIGSHKMALVLQRHFREVVKRGNPVGVSKGQINQDALDDIRDGQDGVVIDVGPDGAFSWAQGPEITASALQLYEMVRQQSTAESGVNDFQKGQTDTQIDFASQLSYIAQQSGVQGAYTAQRFESGIKEDAQAVMRVGGKFQGPITLRLDDDETVEFGPLMPIRPMLGDDGDIAISPMEYKSPAQKLQEVAVLGNVLAMAKTLGPGIGPKFIDQALRAFEVEDRDSWLQAAQAATQQMPAPEMAQPGS